MRNNDTICVPTCGHVFVFRSDPPIKGGPLIHSYLGATSDIVCCRCRPWCKTLKAHVFCRDRARI